jgi:NAD(P)-dependent dehydrogenase (short-subunit alcohol dehydrogenase family)
MGDEEPRHSSSVLAQISLGRAGHREVGTVTAFIASDEAGYLTGQSIHVDGGWEGSDCRLQIADWSWSITGGRLQSVNGWQ